MYRGPAGSAAPTKSGGQTSALTETKLGVKGAAIEKPRAQKERNKEEKEKEKGKARVEERLYPAAASGADHQQQLLLQPEDGDRLEEDGSRLEEEVAHGDAINMSERIEAKTAIAIESMLRIQDSLPPPGGQLLRSTVAVPPGEMRQLQQLSSLNGSRGLDGRRRGSGNGSGSGSGGRRGPKKGWAGRSEVDARRYKAADERCVRRGEVERLSLGMSMGSQAPEKGRPRPDPRQDQDRLERASHDDMTFSIARVDVAGRHAGAQEASSHAKRAEAEAYQIQSRWKMDAQLRSNTDISSSSAQLVGSRRRRHERAGAQHVASFDRGRPGQPTSSKSTKSRARARSNGLPPPSDRARLLRRESERVALVRAEAVFSSRFPEIQKVPMVVAAPLSPRSSGGGGSRRSVRRYSATGPVYAEPRRQEMRPDASAFAVRGSGRR